MKNCLDPVELVIGRDETYVDTETGELSPVRVPISKDEEGRAKPVKVGCGKCIPCLKSRAAQWAVRLQEEAKVSKTCSFITLTYDDEHLKYTLEGYPDLVKKDLQNFMKRLRIQLERGSITLKKGTAQKQITFDSYEEKLKYYAVGEYGSSLQRPHYHVILFNLPTGLLVRPDVIKYGVWRQGHVHISPLNDARIRYVTGYVEKKIHNLEGRSKEFSCMSQGLGISFVHKNKHLKNQPRSHVTLNNGVKIAMPRYYKEKLYTKDQRNKLADDYVKEIKDHKGDPYYGYKWYTEDIKRRANKKRKDNKI